jgi:hypothetical protein
MCLTLVLPCCLRREGALLSALQRQQQRILDGMAQMAAQTAASHQQGELPYPAAAAGLNPQIV